MPERLPSAHRQVDQLPDGVRMAVVTVSGGVVRTMGELIIFVTEDGAAGEGAAGAGAEAGAEVVSTSGTGGSGLTVEVLRRWNIDSRSGPLPVRGRSRQPRAPGVAFVVR